MAARKSMHKGTEFYAYPLRAVIYARVSQDVTGLGKSVSRQIDYCKNVIGQHEEWKLGPIIKDDAISASRFGTKDRPGYRKLLGELREGDVLVIWESSRASRKLDEFVTLRNLCANLGVLLCAGGQVLDLSDPNDRLQAGMRALMSEFEADQLSDRVRAGMEANQIAGKPHNVTRPPFGYRVITNEKGAPAPRQNADGQLVWWEPHPEQAAILREYANRLLNGEPGGALTQEMYQRGIRSRERFEVRDGVKVKVGGGFVEQSVWTRRLQSPVLAGDLVHKGRAVRSGGWEPIFDRDTHLRLLAFIRKRGEHLQRGTAPRWLLSGIARCECGGVVSRRTLHGVPYYACKLGRKYLPGPHTSAACDLVDSKVEAQMLKTLAEEATLETVLAQQRGGSAMDRRKLLAEAQKKEEYLQSFIDAAMDPANGITPQALGQMETRLRPEIEALREKAGPAESEPPAPLRSLLESKDRKAAWDGLEVAEKKEVIRSLFDVQILYIGRGKVRGLDSIKISWKGVSQPM